MKEHPGGPESIMGVVGTDATEVRASSPAPHACVAPPARPHSNPAPPSPPAGVCAPQAYEEVGHSDNAEKILSKFKIGELPKPPGLFDGVPIVPIACALAGALGLVLVRAALRK